MKSHFLCTLVLSIALVQLLQGQTVNPFAPDFVELNFTEKKEYLLKGVNIIGAERRDDNAIKSITGLREGNKITIPSEELSNAIKKLWRLRLFSDVTILLDSLSGQDIYLTIQLKEQPILSG